MFVRVVLKLLCFGHYVLEAYYVTCGCLLYVCNESEVNEVETYEIELV